jgi:hypothetical protein
MKTDVTQALVNEHHLIVKGYQQAETQVDAGFGERYRKLVEAYEQE